MVGIRLGEVLNRIRTVAAARTLAQVADTELLERFAKNQDEAAFAVIVERYGAMVLRSCHRVLRNAHDAEDACQATFLVLARKAGSIRKRQALGGWLHTVAGHVALRLKGEITRRRARERNAAQQCRTESQIQDTLTVLDEELERLPEKYRAPLVLCYLTGKTRDEAADDLGCSVDTLRGRLERGRDRLRERLLKRGVLLPSALLAAALSSQGAWGAMPATLAVSTVKAAGLLALGSVAPETVVSTKVVGLAQEVVKSMFVAKLKTAVALILVASALVLGGGTLIVQASANAQTGVEAVGQQGVQPTIQHKAADEGKKPEQEQAENDPELIFLGAAKFGDDTWHLSLRNTKTGVKSLGGFGNVTSNTEILIDGRKAKLAELQAGMPIVTVSAENGIISKIEAVAADVDAVVQTIDAKRGTISVQVRGTRLNVDNLRVRKGAKITVGKKQVELADIRPGMRVFLRMGTGPDRNVVIGIREEAINDASAPPFTLSLP
jgi:RNA polymerase sigma factor (sigma-70 family)